MPVSQIGSSPTNIESYQPKDTLHLPLELFLYVLSFLPTKERLKIMPVCKDWNFCVLEELRRQYDKILSYTLKFFNNQCHRNDFEVASSFFSDRRSTNAIERRIYSLENKVIELLKEQNSEDIKRIKKNFYNDPNRYSRFSLLFEFVEEERAYLQKTVLTDQEQQEIKNLYVIHNDNDFLMPCVEGFELTENFKLFQLVENLVGLQNYRRALEVAVRITEKNEVQSIEWNLEAFVKIVEHLREDYKEKSLDYEGSLVLKATSKVTRTYKRIRIE